MPGLRSRCLIALAVAGAAATPAVAARWRGMPIGPNTTYVSGPLYPDGTVDYIAAYNAIAGKGVTAKNNAAIPLIRVFGNPRQILARPWAQILAALHIPAKSVPAKRFLPFMQWRRTYDLQHHLPAPAKGAWTRSHHRQDRPWSARRWPLLATYLRQEAPYLHKVVQATRLPRYYIPRNQPQTTPYFMLSNIFLLSEVREAAVALSRRAMLDLHRGQLRHCERNVRAIFRLGALVSQNPCLISYLVGMSIDANACRCQDAVAGWLCQHAVAAPAGLLAPSPRCAPLARAITIGERFEMLDTMFDLLTKGVNQLAGKPGGVRAARLLHATLLFRKINGTYNRMAAFARMRNFARAQRQSRAFYQHVQQAVKNPLAVLNPTAAIYHATIALLLPSLGNANVFRFRARACRRIARTALALAEYHLRHHHFPRTLAGLQRSYMHAIPLDPFNHKPLRYHRTAKGCVVEVTTDGIKHSRGGLKKALATKALRVELPNG